MRHIEQWQPTKYESYRGRIRASRDPQQLSIGSRMITDLVGEIYTRMIPQYCHGSLLDLGCGHVPFYFAYRERVEEVTCIDWAESLHKNVFLDHCHDLTQPFPVDDQQFDAILCSDVLEHISKPENVWREAFRTLRPGGHLILNAPFLYPIHEEPYDFHRYTEFGLRNYAEQAGFEVVQLVGVGSVQHVVADVMAKISLSLPMGNYFSRMIQVLANPSSQSTVTKSFARTKNPRWPLLYLIVSRKPS